MKRNLFLSIILLAALTACNRGPNQNSDTLTSFSLSPLWQSDTTLRTPESVIYDKARDIIYVSNMNLEPRLKDGNGFISRMDKNGNITDLKWVEDMSSPKGMGIIGDTLFVADLDEILAIDINAGKIAKRIVVPGAKMLNDITTDASGALYAADTDGNIIYKYANGIVSPFVTSDLSGPNGLLAEEGRMLVASQVACDFRTIGIPGLEQTIIADSMGHADGVVFTGEEGYYLVSDWNGLVTVINPDNSKGVILNTTATEINAADIWYIEELKLLLVPTFFKNNVMAYTLEQHVKE